MALEAGVPLLLIVFSCVGVSGQWFNTEEMELFDLVEEVNGTFYAFMGIEPVCP